MNRAVVFIFALVFQAEALADEARTKPDFQLARHGESIALSAEIEARVVHQLEALCRTCALNSRDDDMLPSEGLVELREAVLKDAFIRLTYAEPVTFRPGIEVLEVLQALPEGNFVGSLLTRNGPEILSYAKCDGLETLRLMCLDGLAEHLPEEYARNCNIVKQFDTQQRENP